MRPVTAVVLGLVALVTFTVALNAGCEWRDNSQAELEDIAEVSP